MEEQEIYNTLSESAVAAAITAVLGVEPPKEALSPLKAVVDYAEKAFSGEKADRVFMYNPDAVAMWVFQKYTDMFGSVLLNTQLTLPLSCVMPSVTPVCFATMYTGAEPEIHGIRSYTKPVLKTDTVFDALIRRGLKPAIVSTTGDSISKIFLERDMDYYIYDTVAQANAKAFELIEEDKYDLITLYNGDYDANMHKVAPEGEAAIEALRNNMRTFETVARLTEKHWARHNVLLAFAPDHGCHKIDGGCGSHGLYCPEDINIVHFYGFQPKTV